MEKYEDAIRQRPVGKERLAVVYSRFIPRIKRFIDFRSSGKQHLLLPSV